MDAGSQPSESGSRKHGICGANLDEDLPCANDFSPDNFVSGALRGNAERRFVSQEGHLVNSEKGKRDSFVPWVRSLVLTVVLISMLFFVVSAGCSEELTPEEVAHRWANDNVDIGAELLAEWILGAGPVEPSSAAGWLAKEIGGELIEDKIHEVIKWDYSSASSVGDGWEVTATASVSFPKYGAFEASLPLILRIEDQSVVDWRPDYMSAYADAAVPNIGDIVETTSNISEVLNAEGCIEAAREAGAPDSVMEHLKKPASDRNFVEKAAIETAVAAVNLPDGCADSLVGQ